MWIEGHVIVGSREERCESGRIGLTANQQFEGFRHESLDTQVACQAQCDGVGQQGTQKYRPSYRPRFSPDTSGALYLIVPARLELAATTSL